MPGYHIRRPNMLMLVMLLLGAVVCMFLIKKCSRSGDDAPLFGAADSYPVKSLGDTIDVAIEISPLSYSLRGDSAIGLDYDIIREYSATTGRPVKFHAFAPLDWAIKGLEIGNFDVLISALQSTSELKKRLPVTTSVYIDRQTLVQRKNTVHFISSPEELAKDTVWIAKGSPIVDRILNLSSEIGDTIHIVSDAALTAEHLIMLTSSGSITRCVVPLGVARAMADKYSNLDISTPVSFNQFQVWAVTPRRINLKNEIDAWLVKFKQTPRYEQLLEKYLR